MLNGRPQLVIDLTFGRLARKPYMFKALRIIIAIALLAFSGGLFAQNSTVNGFVYDAETGEPVIFTNVYMLGTTYGSATDVNGYYSISKIPAGSYTLTVTFLGYDTLSLPITLKKNEIITKKLLLKRSSVQIREFEVSAEKQEAQNQVRMSVTKITPKQIKQLPSVGAEPDLAQYLQVVPGVVFTGDQGGQLYIRGGSPIMNKVLMDGMIIYNPFHSIGFFSVFETDIIRNADIYTGGFNAEYGGRISSIMDIKTRDGNKTELTGKVGASTFGANVLLEGPMKKQTEAGGGSSSYILSARHSYLEESSKIFYEYIDSAGLPFNYTDIYGKLSFNGSAGSKFNLFGFSFNDNVKYQQISDLSWNSYGGGANFVLVPAGSATLIDGLFSFSNYNINLAEGDLPPRTSEIGGFNGSLNFKYFIRDDELKYGVEVLGFKTDFTFFNSIGREISQVQNTTELAGYMRYKKKAGNFIIDPGLRVHYYTSLSTISVEPRLGVKWNATENLRLKAAAGLYSQNLMAANSDRDVVNLFYGFLSAPDNLPDDFVDENGEVRTIEDPLQRAQHVIIGAEVDITRKLNLNVEGYFKNFSQVTNLNRNKIYNDTPDNADKPEELRKDYIIESGKAYGVDVVLKYDNKRYYFWAVYSLGFNERWDGFQTYNPVWDRRHNVNLLASYLFGKNNSYEFSVRWNLGSGFPFTQTQGYFGEETFSDGVGTDYTTSNAELGTILGELNKGRLPSYHRLDLSLKKSWDLKGKSKLEGTLSITNVYDRENIFYYDRVNNVRVNQLPIMPSLGVVYRF